MHPTGVFGQYGFADFGYTGAVQQGGSGVAGGAEGALEVNHGLVFEQVRVHTPPLLVGLAGGGVVGVEPFADATQDRDWGGFQVIAETEVLVRGDRDVAFPRVGNVVPIQEIRFANVRHVALMAIGFQEMEHPHLFGEIVQEGFAELFGLVVNELQGLFHCGFHDHPQVQMPVTDPVLSAIIIKRFVGPVVLHNQIRQCLVRQFVDPFVQVQ